MMIQKTTPWIQGTLYIFVLQQKLIGSFYEWGKKPAFHGVTTNRQIMLTYIVMLLQSIDMIVSNNMALFLYDT